MNDGIMKKLLLLAEAAKYDVSCSSSGSSRRGMEKGLGSTAAAGICHSFTEDGRCVSLLKVLMSNVCKYDCAYCINRKANDGLRASFTVDELVTVTIEFYRRNYIEGLFLSSAVAHTPDDTMEKMVAVVRTLRINKRFNGYIHMKVIPGASREIIMQAGLYADRLSVNIEIPSEKNLKLLAPEKDHQSVYVPMKYIHEGTIIYQEERKRFKHAQKFAPAGQSTQMIVGASNERDSDILRLSSFLYKKPALKRVYFSGYIPVNQGDPRLPAIKSAPLVRENRLYQADWLMRFYHFEADEIASDQYPDLDQDIDPKLSWAIRHPEFFPIDVNQAEYRDILRVPGIGIKSAQRILSARRVHKLGHDHLSKLGVSLKRAKYFITSQGRTAFTIQEAGPAYVRKILSSKKQPLAIQLPLLLLN